ncbi:MAG: hypothetical protein JXA75_06365 [Candidatus Thermoplasmatota archaeon]|nr:hypothetical protein [Candidatus Thermoplasmatota archaeon]
MKKKWIVVGIMVLCIGVSVVPTISGNTGQKRVDSSHIQTPADETMTDWTEDVCSYNYFRNTWTIITNSTDVEVDNIDLVQTSFTQQGTQVTVSAQVAGRIEDRGHPGNVTNETDEVDYFFILTTSERFYFVGYINQTGFLFYDHVHVNLTASDFTVLNDTLSIAFSLVNLTETYQNLSVTASFVKANLTSPSTIVLLQDTVPNEWAKVLLFGTYKGADQKGAYMTLEADRLWMIRFHPFQLTRFKPGGIIRVSTPYLARMITDRFIIGMVDVLEY